jgi:hypothetical protein
MICAGAGAEARRAPGGPQTVTERAVLRLVIERRYGHQMIVPNLMIFIRPWPETVQHQSAATATAETGLRTILPEPLTCASDLRRPLCL